MPDEKKCPGVECTHFQTDRSMEHFGYCGNDKPCTRNPHAKDEYNPYWEIVDGKTVLRS